MKRAWEISWEVLENAVPKTLSPEELTWTENKFNLGDIEISELRQRWFTPVPGSQAPDFVTIGAIGAMYNMGYDVSEAEALIPEVQRAFDEHDDKAFLQGMALINARLAQAPKIENHPYWSYTCYEGFEQHEKAVSFPEYDYDPNKDKDLFEKMHAAWQAQIAGAAVGTVIEGYHMDHLKATFGEIRDYLRQPTTYNDDVLFELAFLEAFKKKGYDVTSEDIALEWVGRIQYVWSAEEVAMKNLKMGTFPPMSGYYNNPWREWIGAQMRGSICGLAAPGNPRLACKLAWTDGQVSHHNNGILGEVFNALLVSMAFVESDVRTIVKKCIDMIPSDSEYYTVVKYAWDACEKYGEWELAWRDCQEKYKEYNWIHAYPNAAAEVVALYFAKEDFDECMYISAMEGQDVDCNAGQIGTIYGILHGYKGIDKRWTEPFHDDFESLCRGYEKTTVSAIAQATVDSVLAAGNK